VTPGSRPRSDINVQTTTGAVKDSLTSKMMFAFKYIKGILYAILLFCAIYWGVEGSFLDFWEAFLWLLAFIFIELNIFQWNSETEEEKEHVMKV
jgi:hypothetical protein